jgi:uracil-DNA glycosylase family 4
MIVIMVRKPRSCEGCPLYSKPYGKPEGFVPASGSGANGVLIVGEAAGKEEEHTGVPFSGPAGGKLNHLLSLAREERQNFRVHNVLSCRPPMNDLVGAPYEYQAIMHCWPNLDQTVRAMQPKVVLAMGNSALRRMTGHEGILRWRGRPVPATDFPDLWVMPTLHPSFLLPRRGEVERGGFRNPPRMTGVVVMDIKRALELAKNGGQFKRRNYELGHLLDPNPGEFRAWALRYESRLFNHARGAVILATDIETPYKLEKKDEEEFEESERDNQIIRISFAYNDPGNPEQQFQGVSVPWAPTHMATIEFLLGLHGRKAVWNGDGFDIPLIRANNVPVNGRIEDFMWAFHMLQSDLPYGLEFVTSLYTDMEPWKHLNNSDPALYSALDSVATILNAQAIERELRRAA